MLKQIVLALKIYITKIFIKQLSKLKPHKDKIEFQFNSEMLRKM